MLKKMNRHPQFFYILEKINAGHEICNKSHPA